MDTEDREHFRMISSAQVAPLADLPTRQSEGSSASAPDQAYCLRRTEIMLSCYRKDETHNPEVYSAAVSAILSDGYSQEVIDYVTDPRTGIPGKQKFLPAVAEVREACEERAAHLERMKKYSKTKPTRYVPSLRDPKPHPYGEYLARCEKLNINTRPIGAFERGGYLGPTE